MRNTKIEWCDATWNPVTGCYHNCEYCYASKIANRFSASEQDRLHFGDKSQIEGLHVLSEKVQWHCKDGKFRTCAYPFGFEPTLHEYRLDEPQQWKNPQTIFVCSMADLFGKWIPDAWIERVLAACERAPQHRYLFLTKNPKRYEQVCSGYTPPNWWFGWTQTENDGTSVETHHSTKTFISVEPILKRFDSETIGGVEWVIIGAETGNRKGKVVPDYWWIHDLVETCESSGVPVFMKNSLLPIVGEENMRRDFPW